MKKEKNSLSLLLTLFSVSVHTTHRNRDKTNMKKEKKTVSLFF